MVGTPDEPLLPSLAVFDVDGVLADVRHRVHHVTGGHRNWAAFFGAAPLDPVLDEGARMLALERAAGRGITYLTGRPEWCRPDTVDWLDRHGLPSAPLLMRPDHDRRPARVFKAEALHDLSATWDIHLVVDDDPEVVVTLRHHGFPVHHALWGRDDDLDPLLTEIQETQGRT